MRRELLTALALIPLLAACGGSGTGKVSSTRPPPQRPQQRPPVKSIVRPPVTAPPPVAAVHVVPGLEGVIGATANDLLRQFGPARLDVLEGDARKLQFSGAPCVLDVYLYPSAPGREPRATYIDARRGSDGKDVDRTTCASALRKP